LQAENEKEYLPMTSKQKFSRDILGLLGFLGASFMVSGLGAAITATSVGNWYQTLAKPFFNPPDWIFAPVWTSLFIMMAIAGWRVWRKAGQRHQSKVFMLYAVQLGLNLGWSALFFGLQQIGWALTEIIVLLLVLVANTIVFWRIDKAAGILFVPYVLWVSFATLLTASLWRLN
jgi:tryptophan-rich sensory protein